MHKKKILSIEDRIPKIKEMRRKKAKRRLVLYMSVFFLLILIIVYFQSPLSKIKTINVSGNSFLTDEDILDQSKLKPEMNIWSIKEDQIEVELAKNPIIESVKVDRKLPRKIEINVKEYNHVGYLEKDHNYFLVLGNGTILKTAAKTVGYAPIIKGFDEDVYFINMIYELDHVSKSILNLISEVHWTPSKENKNKVMLYMNDGFIVKGTIRDFSDKMRIYPSIVSQIESGSEGVIHIGVGAYFERYNIHQNNSFQGADDNQEDYENNENIKNEEDIVD